MDFGVLMFPRTMRSLRTQLAGMVEERGFESLFFPEHTHIPVSRGTPYAAGGELPRYYWHTYDPFVALTAAATATERLRVGTGICLVVERDPITTAKEVAIARPPIWRALPVRRRRRLERRGDGATTAPMPPGASGSCASASRR